MGTYSKTATSHANSVDVAVSSISGESTTGTVVQTVPVVTPTEDTDEKALLANPCQNISMEAFGSSYKPYKPSSNARSGNRKCRQGFIDKSDRI